MREVHVRIEVAERLHLEMLDQLPRPLDAVEDRRDDHHRPRVVRDAGEIEARQAARRDQVADDALDDLDRQLARRHQRQQRDHTSSAPRAPCAQAYTIAAADEHGVPSAIVPEIARRRMPEEGAPQATRRRGSQPTPRSNWRRPAPIR